jgi:hypothetical protein
MLRVCVNVFRIILEIKTIVSVLEHFVLCEVRPDYVYNTGLSSFRKA